MRPTVSQRAPGAEKTCPTCPPEIGLQPIDNFGICKARPDGKNLYCKSCIRKKVTASRKLQREMRQARREAQAAASAGKTPERKPCVLMVLKLTPAEKVLAAIDHHGECTQKSIRARARLNNDEVCDALADLMLQRREVASRYDAGLEENVYFRRDPPQRHDEEEAEERGGFVRTSWVGVMKAAARL